MEHLVDRAWAKVGRPDGRWTHRFAPDLAPLRCARPVIFHGCRNPDVWINLPGMKDFELYQQILGFFWNFLVIFHWLV